MGKKYEFEKRPTAERHVLRILRWKWTTPRAPIDSTDFFLEKVFFLEIGRRFVTFVNTPARPFRGFKFCQELTLLWNSGNLEHHEEGYLQTVLFLIGISLLFCFLDFRDTE